MAEIPTNLKHFALAVALSTLPIGACAPDENADGLGDGVEETGEEVHTQVTLVLQGGCTPTGKEDTYECPTPPTTELVGIEVTTNDPEFDPNTCQLSANDTESTQIISQPQLTEVAPGEFISDQGGVVVYLGPEEVTLTTDCGDNVAEVTLQPGA